MNHLHLINALQVRPIFHLLILRDEINIMMPKPRRPFGIGHVTHFCGSIQSRLSSQHCFQKRSVVKFGWRDTGNGNWKGKSIRQVRKNTFLALFFSYCDVLFRINLFNSFRLVKQGTSDFKLTDIP